MQREHPLVRAITRTICYADVFSFALTEDELYTYLISSKTYSKDEMKKIYAQAKACSHKRNLFFLKNRADLVPRRLKMQRITKDKMRQTSHIVQLIGWIPTISAMYITGGLSMGNVQPQDDIDLMIVTRPGWLWCTRALVVILTIIFGKYRHKSMKHTTDTWCFNLWLDETALAVPIESRNLYIAHEIVQAKPLLDKRGIHHHFLSQNKWAKKYIPHPFVGLGEKTSSLLKSKENPSVLERVCFWMQSQYMSASKTREKVGMSYAFFHPRNTGKIVMERYRALSKSKVYNRIKFNTRLIRKDDL